VTFKNKSGENLDSDFKLRSIFCRAWGLCFGKADKATILAHAKKLAGSRKRLRLHLWERDRYLSGEEPLSYKRNEWANKAAEEFRTECGADFSTIFEEYSLAQDGDQVLDIIVTEENELWYGMHHHSLGHSPRPGGLYNLTAPKESPSRAWYKIEEFLLWSEFPLRKGDVAIEVGSAPGGVSYALLQRGLRVSGVDPAEMNPVALNHPLFRQVKKPVEHVFKEHLPDKAQWILLDMNIGPALALTEIKRLVDYYPADLLGVVLTLKLHNWKLAIDIPEMIKEIQNMGMSRVRAVQLPANRQEIMVGGLTRLGLAK
jgi:23S rRNA (cytidine2498-2'-O)-methyltransferase